MCGNHIRVMVIRCPAFYRITKKLEDNALMDLELHPAIDRYMGSNRHQHYKSNNQL